LINLLRHNPEFNVEVGGSFCESAGLRVTTTY
jgi:hypothetical protein